MKWRVSDQEVDQKEDLERGCAKRLSSM